MKYPTALHPITETDHELWNLLTNTIPHGRTIMYMVTSVTQTSMMAVGHFIRIFDPAKNGQQLTEDFVTDLKSEFARDGPNVAFSYVPFREDNTHRPPSCVHLNRSS